jgi:hypothetical protein
MEFYSQKDSFLMENFIKQEASSPEITRMIQYRNLLRVFRMYEISTGCGSRIIPRMYNGDAPERHNQSVANPTKTTKRGMDDMEEVPGVHGDVTNNACPTPSPGEMERGITHDPLAISRVFQPSVFPA